MCKTEKLQTKNLLQKLFKSLMLQSFPANASAFTIACCTTT